MKLKTLKDYKGPNNLPIIPNLVLENLQKTAKEWIRQMERMEKSYKTKQGYGEYDPQINDFFDSEYCDFGHLKDWIKHFFNLEDK